MAQHCLTNSAEADTVKQTPASRLCTRRIIAVAKGVREGIDPFAYAESRWRGDAPITAKGIGASAQLDWSVSARLTNLFDAVLEQTVVGRANLRRMLFEVPLLAPDDEIAAHWTEQSKAIRVSRMSLARDTLERKKIAAVTVVTDEALDANSQRVETAIERSFRSALALALDSAFLDSANTGSAATPASVTHDAPTVVSSGDPSADLAALVAAFPGDLSQAVIATDAPTAAQLALWRDTSGGVMFADAGPAGGSLLGLPLLTSRGSPRDTSGGVITMIDGQGIAWAADDLEVYATNEALIEMEDVTPTGAIDTPTAASASPVALFQVGATGFKFIVRANWKVQRPAVAVVTGASYA